MSMTIDGSSLVPVRAIVKNATGDDVTSSTAVEVTVTELLAGAGTPTQAAVVADFEGADAAGLKTELNAMLTKLRAAGIIATA
jgi:hypothetical protein